jgi:hypothetical protein
MSILKQAFCISLPVALLIYIAMWSGHYRREEPLDTIAAAAVEPFCYLSALVMLIVKPKR